jgi:hypothetical protein
VSKVTRGWYVSEITGIGIVNQRSLAVLRQTGQPVVKDEARVNPLPETMPILLAWGDEAFESDFMWDDE